MKIGSRNLLPPDVAKQRGAVIALVAVSMIVLVSLAALAIDLSHLYVVRNELQNAADAGALAGAGVLYLDSGASLNANANQIAYEVATANKSLSAAGNIDVDVNWTGGNTGDVQRGHWSFGMGSLARGFYPNDSLSTVVLYNTTTVQLDENTNFINAVRVVANRSDTPASSFFAGLFGYDDFLLSADAVAYIGFAGTLRPYDVDQPIAICKQSIYDESTGTYDCNTGRMINSGGGTTTNTGGWTNFSQPCQTANAPSIDTDTTTCNNGNKKQLIIGAGMGTNGGEITPVFNDIETCWKKSASPADTDWRGFPKIPMEMNLPVVDCPSNNVGPCSQLWGAVTLEVLWIKESGADPKWEQIPLEMDGWTCSKWNGTEWKGSVKIDDVISLADRKACWQEFASTFNLHMADGTPVGGLVPNEMKSTLYFKPSCEPQEPRGITGGENFGILADIPVLVE